MAEKRNLSIDLIKTIAMIGVILLHSNIQFIDSSTVSIPDILYDLGMFSIPLFFMVSGYLLIDRTENTYAYVFRKVLRILKFVAIITISFSLLVSLVIGFDVHTITRFCLGAFVQKGPFGVYWYLGAIILCYLALPSLSKIIHSSRLTYLLISIGFIVLAEFFFTQTVANSYYGGHIVELDVPATFRIWYIFLYFTLGGVIKMITSKTEMRLPMVVVILAVVVSIVFKELYDKPINQEYASLFYSSFVCIFACVTIFVYLSQRKIQSNAFVTTISELFLPVYTIHMFIIQLFSRITMNLPIGNGLKSIVTSFFAIVLSISISYFIMKIPIMRKVFKI